MSFWANKLWSLNAGPSDVLVGHGKTSKFTLKKKRSKSGTYYVMKYADGEMLDIWEDCVLHERGDTHFDWATTPLEPWGGKDNADYLQAIKGNLNSATTADTKRLEGEIDFGSRKERVTFFLARKALTTGAPMLILIVEKNFWWSRNPPMGAGPGDDGTAHGNNN